MRIYRLFAVVLVLLISGCAYFNTFYNAKRYYRAAQNETRKNMNEALTQAESSNYDKAIEKSLKLLDEYPESRYVDDALLLLGKSYFYKKEYNKSLEYLNYLHQSFPQSKLNSEARLWFGRNYLEMHQFAAADSAFKPLILKNDSKATKALANYYLGQAEAREGKFEGAIRYYQESLNLGLGEKQAEALFQIGAAYDTLNVQDKAADYFLRVEDAEPSWELLFESRYRYAIALRKMNRIDEAIRQFERLLSDQKNSKRFGEIKLEIGQCSEDQGDVTGAILAYHDLIQEHPRTKEAAEAYYRLGHIYEKEKVDYERALASYYQIPLVYPSYELADSAEVKKLSLQRFMALREVIGMANEGREGSVDLTQMQAVSDSLARQLVAEMDSTKQNSAANTNQNPSNAADRRNQVQQGGPPTNQQGSRSANNQRRNPTSTHNKELDVFSTEETDRNLFLLAELYLFQMSLPDSALALYKRIIDEFPESPYRMRALYNSGYILERDLKDTSAAERYKQMLLRQYPQSEQAKRIRKNEGIDQDLTAADSLSQLLHEAERYLFDKKDYQGADTLYRRIYNRYPDHAEGARALFARAWIRDECLHQDQEARRLYKKVKDEYPGTDYAVRAGKLLAAKIEDNQNKEDTSVKNKQEPPLIDNTKLEGVDMKINPSGPVEGLEALQNLLDFPREIPLSSIPATMKVRVLINSDGKPQRVILEEPTGNERIDSVVQRVCMQVRYYPPSEKDESGNGWVQVNLFLRPDNLP